MEEPSKFKLRLPDGRSVEADSAWEAVAWLNAKALCPEADPWRFMVRVAARQRELDGLHVDSRDPQRFLVDLARVGWLELCRDGQAGPAGQIDSDPHQPPVSRGA